MRILAGILHPTNGMLHIGDYDGNTERDRSTIKHVLGYLPQDFGVYPDLSAREFLDYIGILKGLDDCSARKRRVQELLEIVSLTPVANPQAQDILRWHEASYRDRTGATQ